MRIWAAAVAVTAVAVAATGVAACAVHPVLPLQLPRSQSCVVRADGEVTLGNAQMANAATITAVGIRRGVPVRGVVVALATALQESKLQNLASGDRDSQGLFQQRPSQDWGDPGQITDPRYAANAFYTALLKVPGWQNMRVTDAAQAVQRSAAPEAYQRWADEAEVLARALVGDATSAVNCTVTIEPDKRGPTAADALVQGLRLDWGSVSTSPTSGFAGMSLAPASSRAGWQYAHWLVSHAGDHGIRRVQFAGQEWTAKGGEWKAGGGSSPAPTGSVVAEVYADS